MMMVNFFKRAFLLSIIQILNVRCIHSFKEIVILAIRSATKIPVADYIIWQALHHAVIILTL